MPAILPVVSTVAMSDQGSPPGNETTGSYNGARSEGGVTNDTSGPNTTWTQPSANSEQTGKTASFGTVLNASVAGTSKTAKTKSSDTSATASPASTQINPASLLSLATVAAQLTLAATDSKPATGAPKDQAPADVSGAAVLAANAKSTTVETGIQTVPAVSVDDKTRQAVAGTTAGTLTIAAQKPETADQVLPTPTSDAKPTAKSLQFSEAINAAQATQSLPTKNQATNGEPVVDVKSAVEGQAASYAASSNPGYTVSGTATGIKSAVTTPVNSITAGDSSQAVTVDAIHHDTSGSAGNNSNDHGSQGGSNGQMSFGSFAQAHAASSAAGPTAQAAISSSSVAERINVINQISQHVGASAASTPANGTQSVTVHVSPEHWGDMSIKLTSNTAEGANGPITATITTQSAAATNALTSHVDDLKSSLAASGIKLDKVEITTADKSTIAQTALSADRAATTSGAQGSGLQSGQQQFSGNQHNSAGAHNGQSVSTNLGDQNRGQNSQQAFASMLNGDGQGGQRATSYGSSMQPMNTDAIDDSAAAMSASTVNTGASGINVLA